MRPTQVAAAAAAALVPNLALFLEPGQGKTAAILTALDVVRAWPALVVAPAQVVVADVWGKEARQWDHLRHLRVTPLLGGPAARDAVLARQPEHIEVVSYENLVKLHHAVPLASRYRSLVLDELSEMAHAGTKRYRALRNVVQLIPRRHGLTGSPVPNHYLDLWGELFMVAGEAPLGPRFGDFQSQYFEPIDYLGRVWRLKCCEVCLGPRHQCKGLWRHCECHRRQVADLKRRIAPYVFTLPRGTPSPNPPVRVNRIEVPMPVVTAELSRKLLKDLWAKLPSGVELEALAASTVAMKLRQLAGGAVYYGETRDKKWEAVHDAKLLALDTLLNELQGEPAVVFYEFRHEAERIAKRLGGRVTVLGPGVIDRWNAGGIEVLLLHPQSAGLGVNLQGGGHHVIWFALPWGWKAFIQGNGRVARPGQAAPEVTAHELLCGPSDEWVAACLDRKGFADREILYS